MRMVAEVIASAFGSSLSWKGTLGGKEVCHAFELFTEVTLGAVIEPGNRVSYTNDLCYEPFDLNDSYGYCLVASVRAASKLRIAALRLDKARRSYRSSAANSEIFVLRDARELFFTRKRLRGKHVPNLIDVDRHRAGALMAQSHLSDPQLLLVDLGRLEPGSTNSRDRPSGQG